MWFEICPSLVIGGRTNGHLRRRGGSRQPQLYQPARRRAPVQLNYSRLRGGRLSLPLRVPSDVKQPLQPAFSLHHLRGCIVKVAVALGIMASRTDFGLLRCHVQVAVFVMATGILVILAGASQNASAPGTRYSIACVHVSVAHYKWTEVSTRKWYCWPVLAIYGLIS